MMCYLQYPAYYTFITPNDISINGQMSPRSPVLQWKLFLLITFLRNIFLFLHLRIYEALYFVFYIV